MAKYGKLYEINTITGMKNKYPILEIDKNYFHCKIYGANFIQSISTNPKFGKPIISLNEYYETINHRKDFNGFVFVPVHIKEYPILPKQYFWEKILEELNEKAEKLIKEIDHMQYDFEICSKELNRIKEYLFQLMKKGEP